MSYEMKDMLEIAIANNDSLWEVEVIESLQSELDRLYSQEAKAKAFDQYHATISSHLHLKSEPEFSSPPTEVLSDIIDIHNKYESGGSDD